MTFSKNTRIPNFIKVRPARSKLFACGRTYWHDKTNSHFSQLYKRT